MQKQKKLRVALICGGPSLERGISLNSARSVLDHLEDDNIEIVPVYFDYQKRAYSISTKQLYSNTPSDFDFKLAETAKALDKKSLIRLLKSVDIAFPVIHGHFGEDGELQRFLERKKIPFIGSGSSACKRAFDKYEANEFIRGKGFFALPSTVLKIYHNDHLKILKSFFTEHKIRRAIVKPASGGSSIGVYSVATVEEALERAQYLFSKRIDTRVVVEPFCTGREFTVIILQNRFNMPVAVIPTEMELDYSRHQIFDYRKKYLPTNRITYHCPPRFDNETIERIQVQAEQLFTALGMKDFARFDGWIMKDGGVCFSDFNPISGMEQNSFLFQQSSRIGFSHRDLLRYVVKHACRRYGIPFPDPKKSEAKRKKLVNVIFGGNTSERQVSLMSGTNAWLKLRRSQKYEPKPYLLDLKGDVWRLPYALTLNHTVEEIYENCIHADEGEKRLKCLEEKVSLRLAPEDGEITEPFFIPTKTPLRKFIDESPFLFLGLHGGIGEDGTIQGMLSKKKIKFNGPGESASRLCMDKWATSMRLKGLESQGIFTSPKRSSPARELTGLTKITAEKYWKSLQSELHAKTIIIKPQSEGCSSGIVPLSSPEDLLTYGKFVREKANIIPPHTFRKQENIVEMPLGKISRVIFEKFVETDVIRVKGKKLKWKKRSGWIELTVAVLEENGILRSLNPSLTVAEGAVLTVEEKFQGGTGVNITPPPPAVIRGPVLTKIRHSIEVVARKLGIEGYARIDIFAHAETGDIIVIEANTLPALTPSTVLFHQALAEPKPMFPSELMEKLIENKGY